MVIKRLRVSVSILIMLCMLLAEGLQLHVFAFGVPAVSLQQTNVTISGTAETGTTVSCVVLKTGYEDINAVNASQVKQAYYYAKDYMVTDGTYRFSYTMRDNDPSGDYRVFVGGDGAIPQGVPYYYASGEDRSRAISVINEAAQADALTTALTGDPVLVRVYSALGFAIDRYAGFSEQAKQYVNGKLFRNGVDYTGAGAATEAADIFNKSVAVAMIGDASESELFHILEQNNDILRLDLSASSLYGGLREAEKTVFAKALHGRMPLDSVIEVVTAFEQELRVQYLNRISYGEFESFCNTHNTYLGFDLDKYTALDDTGKTYVAKHMADATFANLAQAHTDYIDFIAGAPHDPKPSHTGGSGGGGHTTSTAYVNTAVTPVPQNNVNPTPVPARFNDLSSVEWAKDSILKLADKGVVSGDGSGAFRPNDAIKREEFLKLAMEAFGLVKEDATCSFSDVPQGIWYYKYVATGVSLGIVNGVENTKFGTGTLITRQDMASMAYRIVKHANPKLQGSQTLNFNDNDDISAYAKEAVSYMNTAGIINGMGNGKFAPGMIATRAQACKIIASLLAKAQTK